MAKQQQQKVTPEQLKGAHGVVPTVRVQGEKGPMTINVSDYDEEEHTLVKGEKAPSAGKSSKAGLEDMTKDELKQRLDKQGVEYHSDATKDELLKLAQKGG